MICTLELPFRLKGTDKIHTEGLSKFHPNIYSILNVNCAARTVGLTILNNLTVVLDLTYQKGPKVLQGALKDSHNFKYQIKIKDFKNFMASIIT